MDQDLESAEPWKPEVEHHHVRVKEGALLERLPPVSGMPDDTERGSVVARHGDDLPDHGMVIDHQDPHRFRLAHAYPHEEGPDSPGPPSSVAYLVVKSKRIFCPLTKSIS